MLKRDTGKLMFATIARPRRRAAAVRLEGGASATTGSPRCKALDLGDWVGVHGTVMTTRKGEL